MDGNDFGLFQTDGATMLAKQRLNIIHEFKYTVQNNCIIKYNVPQL